MCLHWVSNTMILEAIGFSVGMEERMGNGDRKFWKMQTESSRFPGAQGKVDLDYYTPQCKSDTDHSELVQTLQA